MPRSNFIASLPSVVLTVLLVSGVSAADATAAKVAAKTLLEKGWDKTPAARTVADQFDLDVPPLKGDLLLRASHWLVLMYQGRYDDALLSVHKFLKDQPSNLSALRAETSIYIIKKDYRQAMDAAERLAQAASKNASADKAALAAQEEAIAFLGRIVGYLEGPAAKPADADRRKKFESQVLALLAEPQQKKLGEAKTGVLDEFQRLTAAAAEAAQDAKQAAEGEKQKKLDQLSKENEQLSKEAGKVEDRERQLADELKRTLAELDRQDAFLLQRNTLLQGQLVAFANQASTAKANADRLSQQAAREQNADTRQRIQQDAAQALSTMSLFQGRIDATQIEIASIQGFRNSIQQMRQQAASGAVIQDHQLQALHKGIEQGKLKTEGQQKRTEHAKTTTSAKTIVFDNQAHAFSHYDSFLFNELRANLLAKVQ